MKKMWWLSLLLALPLASAQTPSSVIGGIWNKILMIGSLSFLQGFGLVGFTRILLWVLIFAIFFALLSFLGASGDSSTKSLKFIKRNQAIVIAAVLATISAIFLPAAAILAVGAGWATAIGLILIGAPILGLGYVLWNIPGKDKQGKDIPETKGTVILKLLLSMLLFWVLSAMNYSLQAEKGVNIGSPSVAGTMANFIAWALYITSIMIIYYVVKFFFVGRNDEEAEKQWQEGGKALGKWVGKKMDERKAAEEMQRRAKEVNEPKSYLVQAVEDCEELLRALYRSARTPEERSKAVNKAKKNLKSLKKNMKKAVRSLRYLRRKEKGRVYEIFDNLYSHAGVALSRARDISLPKPDSEAWERQLAGIHGLVKGPQGVQGICGAIIKALDAFVEAQEVHLSQIEAAQRAGQHAEERAQQQEQGQQAAQQRVQEQARVQGSAQPRRRTLRSRPAAVVRRRR